MTTARRETIRIASNYLRILATFAMGLIVVRILVGFGEDVFNVFAIIVIGGGVGVMLKELVRIAIVPGLARSLADDQYRFAATYAACQWSALILVALGLGLMAILYGALPYFDISPALLDAARIFVIARAVQMAMTIALAPSLNLLMATQRQGQANVLLTAERCTDLFGALVALWWAADSAPAQLTAYALSSTLALAAVYAVAIIHIRRLDPSFRACFGRTDRAAWGEVTSRLGWTAVVVLSMNLYFRFDTFFVNLTFGAIATVAFGISVQLTGYLRQLTAGLVNGLDAVTAGFSAKSAGTTMSAASLRDASSTLQGLVVSLSVGFLLVAIDDALAVWLGGVSDRAEEILPLAATLTLIMIIGIAARSLTEGWMAIMAGGGHIGAYAKWLLPGALLNPPLVFAAVHWLAPDQGVLPVAIVFVLLQSVVHGVIVTRVAARVLETTVRDLLTPFIMPLLLAVLVTAAAYVLANVLPFEGALPGLLRDLAVFCLGGGAALAVCLVAIRRRIRAHSAVAMQ